MNKPLPMTPYKDLIINFQSRTAYKYAYDKVHFEMGYRIGLDSEFARIGVTRTIQGADIYYKQND